MKKTRILFMGRKPVAAKCLRYLSQRNDVEIVGVLTDSHLEISPTLDVAKDNGYKIFSFDEALSKLKSKDLSFDLGLSMLFWRRLRDEFLTAPSLGIINFHPAPLPEYKGTAGYNIAILEGCDSWAVTAHYVDESIDTGKIIEVSRFHISKDKETAKSLEKLAQIELENQFIRIVDKAISSIAPLPSVPNIGGRYISRPEMESMKEIKSGDDIARKIRAFWFPPYDGAYININGVKYTLVDQFILEQLADQSSSSLFTTKSLNRK